MTSLQWATFSDSLGDISINLIAAFIGAALVWIHNAVRRWSKQYRARRFWRQLALQPLTVALGGSQGPMGARTWEQSGLIGLGDVNTLLAVKNQLELLHTQSSVVVDSNVPPTEWGKNFVLIGGPDANQLTAVMIDRMQQLLTFVFPFWRDHGVSIEDKSKGMIVAPEHDETGLRVDYGLVIRAPNPLSEGHNEVLILAGCWGYGTLAAAQILTDKKFLANEIVSSGSPFEALVKTSVVANVNHATTIIEVRKINGFVGNTN